MRVIEYKTGRDYGSEQVLFITIEKEVTDEYGITTTTASFRDHARHIAGRVNTMTLGFESIGRAVLSEYDAGNYESI